ncbi:hypothetical protein BC332_29188 [Capsicum chinense]|nr:hypothetical protein BC332_29188 [Capsicum chinense]
MDQRFILHSLSSLVRPSRLGSSLYRLSSSFLGWATSLRIFLMLDFSNGSHCFFSLRIRLFVACGLGGSVRSSLWAWCFVCSWIGKSIVSTLKAIAFQVERLFKSVLSRLLERKPKISLVLDKYIEIFVEPWREYQLIFSRIPYHASHGDLSIDKSEGPPWNKFLKSFNGWEGSHRNEAYRHADHQIGDWAPSQRFDEMAHPTQERLCHRGTHGWKQSLWFVLISEILSRNCALRGDAANPTEDFMDFFSEKREVRLGKGIDPTHGWIKGSKSGSLFILFIGRISPIVQARRFGVGNLIPLEAHILCHKIGCALPLFLYQKITLCERLTLNFSQWEESPYLRILLDKLGVTISEAKSIIPKTSCVEFAKRFWVKSMQIKLSPVSLRLLLSCRMTIGLCSIRNKYPVSVSTLQWLVGTGFRIRSCLFLTQSKRWERLKATFCKPNRSHPLPLEWWIGRFGNLNPYLKGKIMDYLRRELKPKEIYLFPKKMMFDKESNILEHTVILNWCYDMGVDWDLSTTPRWFLDPNTVIQFDRWIYGGILGGDFMMAPVGLPSPVKGRRP